MAQLPVSAGRPRRVNFEWGPQPYAKAPHRDLACQLQADSDGVRLTRDTDAAGPRWHRDAAQRELDVRLDAN
jgi:hypothetical protein